MPTQPAAVAPLLRLLAAAGAPQTKLSLFAQLKAEEIAEAETLAALRWLIARGLVEDAPTAPTGETQVRVTDAGAAQASRQN